MAFAEDLAPFFDTGDFADDATVGGVAVKGIFDADYQLGLGVVSGSSPTLRIITTAAPSVALGDAVVVLGVNYTVAAVEDTRTGDTLLRLQEA